MLKLLENKTRISKQDIGNSVLQVLRWVLLVVLVVLSSIEVILLIGRHINMKSVA